MTFDYELFLGERSGSVTKCLIEPTNFLIQLFDKYRITNAIFFVDTTYLMRLKNEGHIETNKDYKIISEQLVRLLNKGHYVFPHIHPHWLDAVYLNDSNQWKLSDHSKYRFHNLNDTAKAELFNGSIAILNEIFKSAVKSHPIDCYRAGGWSIQPFEDFKPFFAKHKITNEFSVVKGFRNLSDAQYFNFSDCPEKSIYKFNDNPCIESEQGEFKEFTISVVEIKPLTYLLGKLWGKFLWKIGNRSIGDGISMVMKEGNITNGKKEFIRSDVKEMLSVELLTLTKLRVYKKFVSTNNFIHFISHPKMLSPHNLNCFDALVKHIITNYELQTDYSHMPLN